jgi:hypothetical protein
VLGTPVIMEVKNPETKLCNEGEGNRVELKNEILERLFLFSN